MAPGICFKCVAKDGVVVTLTKERYDGHILVEHQALEWEFEYPASIIEDALRNAEEIQPGNRPDTRIYTGPHVVPNGRSTGFRLRRPAPRRMRVVVKLEREDQGFVLTAYAPTVRRG